MQAEPKTIAERTFEQALPARGSAADRARTQLAPAELKRTIGTIASVRAEIISRLGRVLPAERYDLIIGRSASAAHGEPRVAPLALQSLPLPCTTKN